MIPVDSYITTYGGRLQDCRTCGNKIDLCTCHKKPNMKNVVDITNAIIKNLNNDLTFNIFWGRTYNEDKERIKINIDNTLRKLIKEE